MVTFSGVWSFASAVLRSPIDLLLEGTIDLAIVAGQRSRPELEWTPLFEDELVAVTPPRHRFARCAHVEATAFADEVYITYSLTYEPGFEAERFMRPANVHPKRFVRVELPEAIAELVRAGLGVSVLSQWAIEPYLRAGSLAATRLTKHGLKLDWFAAVRKSDGDGSPAARLASLLAAWCATPRGGFRSVTRPN